MNPTILSHYSKDTLYRVIEMYTKIPVEIKEIGNENKFYIRMKL